MDPAEIEFLAENELIDIVPNFTHAPMHLLCGTFGPFEPAVQMQVPLWLALALRTKQRCRISPPDWLSVEFLTELKEREEAEPLFTPVPNPHFRELASLLLQNAAEDLPHSERIRCLIKDIWDVRMSKLRKSFHLFLRSDVASARLTHLTRMEICTMRTFLTKSLDQVFKLKHSATSVPDLANEQLAVSNARTRRGAAAAAAAAASGRSQ